MKTLHANGVAYDDRIRDIELRVERLGRELAAAAFEVKVERGTMTPTRTAHAVRLFNKDASVAVILTREEFLDDFGLFERTAVPKLRTAIATLKPR